MSDRPLHVGIPPGYSPTTLGIAALTDLQPSAKFIQADGRPFDPLTYPEYAALMTPLADVIDSLCYSSLLSKFAGLGDYSSAILYTGTDGVEYTGTLGKVASGMGAGVGILHSSSAVLFAPKTGTDKVFTSTDGITFTQRTLTGAAGLTGYGDVLNSKLVVYDSDGGLFHSSDNGVNWTHVTAVTTGAGAAFNSGAWNGSVYVFVDDGVAGAGEIITTPDLATFTPRASAGTGPIKAVLWNTTQAKFIAAGTNLALAAPEIQTSANGTTGWAAQTPGAGGTIINVLLADTGNKIIALGDTIQVSTNTTLWTTKLTPAQTVLFAAYNPSGTLIAGIAGGASDYVVTSSDSNTFTEATQNVSAYLVPIQNWVNGHAQNVPAWVQVLP